MTPLVREIRIPNDARRLSDVRTFVMQFLQQLPSPPKEPTTLVLAVDEAVTNVIEHAYHDNDARGDIRVELRGDDGRFEVLVEDRGSPFDPDSVPSPVIEEHVREGRRKGLGLFLMRRIMDEVNYEFAPGQPNRLRMVKYMKTEVRS